MKRFVSKVQNLSQKAVELKAAMQQVPPKVAEIREAVAATTGQLQQLKSEIQYSVADLKADHETSLSEALQEINDSADVFAKAGFVLDGVDIEISPVQRALVHLLRAEDVPASVLRALADANQHRRTTRAILSALLQANQMAETVELGVLIYNEVIVGIGPIPSVRLCWRLEQSEPEPAVQTSPTVAIAPVTATPAPQTSAFVTSSFFERKEVEHKEEPSLASAQPIAAPLASAASPVESKPVATPESPAPTETSNDPLARFKKMPVLGR